MPNATKWLRLVLGAEQIREGLEFVITDQLLKALIELNFPQGLVFYVKSPSLPHSFPVVFYLPPRTAAACQGVVRDYSWMECDAPDRSGLSVFPG